MRDKHRLLRFLRYRLRTDPGWACRGLIRLYWNDRMRQPNSGFVVADQAALTEHARRILRRDPVPSHTLAYLRSVLPKYSKQLLEGLGSAGTIKLREAMNRLPT